MRLVTMFLNSLAIQIMVSIAMLSLAFVKQDEIGYSIVVSTFHVFGVFLILRLVFMLLLGYLLLHSKREPLSNFRKQTIVNAIISGVILFWSLFDKNYMWLHSYIYIPLILSFFLFTYLVPVRELKRVSFLLLQGGFQVKNAFELMVKNRSQTFIFKV